MKILMVNKFFYIKGGSETYYFALKKKLEAHGHKVIDFSMRDRKNLYSQYSGYFVSNVDYNGEQSVLQKMKMITQIVYSVEAKAKFERLVQDTKPDIIHLHIFQHQLSPSILDVAKKYNLPVVYTAHDLKMICLNYKMMTHGKICEECKGGHYMHCLKNKCVKDSYLKSLINVAEGYTHKWRKSYDVINTIITPSDFYRKKFVEFGVEPERVIHLPNFLNQAVPEIKPREDTESYLLYFGRLSEEKGIITLVRAVEQTGSLLYIVGSGPIEAEIKEYVELHSLSNVKMLGFKSGQELKNIVGNAKAVVLPSEWYENGPYSAIEALQLGRPIIGSDLGGIPELVDRNGFIFSHGNVQALVEAIHQLDKLTAQEYAQCVKRSKILFKQNYMSEKHYDGLINIYQKAMRKKTM